MCLANLYPKDTCLGIQKKKFCIEKPKFELLEN